MSNEYVEPNPDLPDDFDRRDSQSMWTGQYSRDGQYPKSAETQEPAVSEPRPVRGRLAGYADVNAKARETETELQSTPMPEVDEATRKKIAEEASAKAEQMAAEQRARRLDEAQR
jgi:hypothetical protein